MLLVLHTNAATGCLDEGAHDIVREVTFELLKVGRHGASWARKGLPALSTGLASGRQGSAAEDGRYCTETKGQDWGL